MKSLYDTLGVAKTATDKELKKAFRSLARDLHPDRNKASEAEERFKAVNSAYEVLSDPERRALYDQFGEASLQSGFNPDFARQAGGFRSGAGFGEAGLDMDDLLGSLFGRGSGFPGGGGFSRGPAGLRATLNIDFRTAALGGERELSFDGGRSLRVRIPAGVRDGGTLRLKGKAPDGGDVRLTLSVADDPHFERRGNDLHTTVEVTVGQALLGATIEVQTLQSPVRLKVPECSGNGQRLRVRGKGIQKGATRGDLYVTLQVVLPERLTDEARQAIGVLESCYGEARQTEAA